jgi:glycosyltransferase involved in cell wall biosynthesis
MPKVSIIITVYNLAKYLRQTLESAVTQDYDNIEIIVSDDCSTDNSQLIIKEFVSLYPNRVKAIYNNENRGITKNSNIALSYASGDLIALLDGDDIFLPGKIKKQVQMFIENPNMTLCYHSGEVFDSDTETTLYISNQKTSEDINNAIDIITKGATPITSSVMLRKNAIPENGFNEKLLSVNDWWLFIEVSLKGEVGKLKGVYAKYRKHKKGISEKSLQLLEESLQTLDLIVEAHPDLLFLDEVCKKGKARYIVGEAYRQMDVDISVSKMLLVRAISLDKSNFRYFILLYILKLFPFSSKLGKLMNKYKYLIKRII